MLSKIAKMRLQLFCFYNQGLHFGLGVVLRLFVLDGDLILANFQSSLFRELQSQPIPSTFKNIPVDIHN